MTDKWKTYFENTKSRPPRSLLVEALPSVHRKDLALDLGAGALNDTIYLLSQNFKRVVAVDYTPIAEEVAKDLPPDRFTYAISKLEDFEFPSNVNLVNAQYSLPFIHPEKFDGVWRNIRQSLAPEGIFAGQLFGDRDEWFSDTNMNFHTKENASELFDGLEVITFKEEEVDRPTVVGVMKHWHMFHVIARRK